MSDTGGFHSRKLLGIWGGTFDPVHNGHIQLALELKRRLAMDEMRLMPCNIPAHRALPVASAQQRSAMLALALRDCPALCVDERELLRGGVSYTVDTLESLREEYGAMCSLILCMGADAFAAFDTWQRYADILQLAHVVVVQRNSTQLQCNSAAITNLLQRYGTQDETCLARHAAGSILQCAVTPWAVSSTDIRRRLVSGEDVSMFVPPRVMDFIQQQQLYRKQ